jgi:prepilin peptidase CpaA
VRAGNLNSSKHSLTCSVCCAQKEGFAVDRILLPITVVLGGALIAGVTDLWRFKVHNLVTLPLLFSGLVYHAVWGTGLPNSLLGVACGSGLLLLFYSMGGMGAGDVKLMAGIGAWLGIPYTLYVFVAASILAALYALVLIVLCGRVRETWVNLQIIWHRVAVFGRHLGAEDQIEAEVQRGDRRRRIIPFAAMVAVGVVVVFVWFWMGG